MPPPIGHNSVGASSSISPSATGTISLDGLQSLDGSLVAEGASELSELSAPNLEEVNGYIYLIDLESLDTLDFPNLTSISDQIRLVDLPGLSQLSFPATLGKCPRVTVSGTGLQTLEGVDPTGTTDGLNITYNKNLAGSLNFSMTSTRASTQGKITIEFNAPGLSAAFPNLETAQHIDLSNLSAVELPELTECYELVLRANTFQKFSAPKLTDVGNSTTYGVFLQDNQGLVDVEFPALVRTGGLTLQNNSRVDTLTMEKLQQTNEAIVLEGSFTSVSFPDLQDVQQFSLHTSATDFDCAPLEQYKSQNVIKSLTCDTGNTTSSSSPSSSTSSGSSLSTGAKAGIGVGVAIAALLAAAAAGFYFWRARDRRRQEERRAAAAAAAASAENGGDKRDKADTPPVYESVAHLPANGLGARPGGGAGKEGGRDGSPARSRHEMEAEPNQIHELQAGDTYVELAGESARPVKR
ncbi:hypothetical protein BFW01_g11802 [Lasiodiplodia theobromae]|nr:hypothetical protein BFW01_g11802 [Lasiodiplodia theobromae]